MNKNEKEILDKCRKLIVPCNKALSEAFALWLKEKYNNCTMDDIITSMGLLRDIEQLLGYKEDEQNIKGWTQTKINYEE